MPIYILTFRNLQNAICETPLNFPNFVPFRRLARRERLFIPKPFRKLRRVRVFVQPQVLTALQKLIQSWKTVRFHLFQMKRDYRFFLPVRLFRFLRAITGIYEPLRKQRAEYRAIFYFR